MTADGPCRVPPVTRRSAPAAAAPVRAALVSVEAAEGAAFSCGSLPRVGSSDAAAPPLHDAVTRLSPESPS
ncbi:hypothetical protein E0493_18035 [Roseomonas sp. M0104]|uniref:Uncharacterized protein n=1 Tax=Teichococcus coralli TaxID=2545983 RepID=A0A845BPC0_9PROT|nr:hypothetical protein [Pseudoroseomonas coralli]MXP65249.1 hypothetical protein [Pseudoroseomonas coralli]